MILISFANVSSIMTIYTVNVLSRNLDPIHYVQYFPFGICLTYWPSLPFFCFSKGKRWGRMRARLYCTLFAYIDFILLWRFRQQIHRIRLRWDLLDEFLGARNMLLIIFTLDIGLLYVLRNYRWTSLFYTDCFIYISSIFFPGESKLFHRGEGVLLKWQSSFSNFPFHNVTSGVLKLPYLKGICPFNILYRRI